MSEIESNARRKDSMLPIDAGRHLREMMEAMYEGRSVRTPAEFQTDLRALRVAADMLDPPAQAMAKTGGRSGPPPA